MAFEQYGNDISGALNMGGGITLGATSPLTVTVVDGSLFPATGNFRIRIDNEILLCTARSTNDLTCTRAQEGTSAAAHANGQTVDLMLTKGALEALIAKGQVRDAYANRPAASLAGRVFRPTDAAMGFYDDGSAWQGFGPVFPLTPVATGDLATWVNQGTATLTQAGPGVRLDWPAASNSGDNLRGVFRSVPATPWSVTALIVPHLSGDTFERAGIGLRESGTGKLYAYYIDMQSSNTDCNNPALIVAKWSSPTAYSAGVPGGTLPNASWRLLAGNGLPVFLRMRDDGTSVYFELSYDSQFWYLAGTESRTAFMSGGPNQAGLLVEKFNGSHEVAVTCLSWTIG